MSDLRLQARPALAGIAVPGRFGKATAKPGVIVTERTGLGLATVAARKGKEDALKSAVRDVYKAELPDKPAVVQGAAVSFIGQGPGQWLAISEALAKGALASDLASRLGGLASISDQSDARAVIRVSGPRARDVLAKGLPIDLDPRAFPLGSAATSVISLMGVQVWQVDDTRSYDIAVFCSLAASFWRWLTASAAEFGYEVATDRR